MWSPGHDGEPAKWKLQKLDNDNHPVEFPKLESQDADPMFASFEYPEIEINGKNGKIGNIREKVPEWTYFSESSEQSNDVRVKVKPAFKRIDRPLSDIAE